MEISSCTWNEFYHALTGLVITEDQGCGAPCGAHQPLSVGWATHFTGRRGESITSREVVARSIFLGCLSVAWWLPDLFSGKWTRSVVKVSCSWFKPTALMRYQHRRWGLRRSVSAETWSEKLLLLSFSMLDYPQALPVPICAQMWQHMATKWTKNVIFTGENWNRNWYCRCVLERVFRWKMLCFTCFRRFQMEVEISIKVTTLLCLSWSHQVFCQGFITFHLPFHWTCWLKQPRKHMVRKYEMSPGRFSFNLVSIPNHRGGSLKRSWFWLVFRVLQITVMEPGLRSWSPGTDCQLVQL